MCAAEDVQRHYTRMGSLHSPQAEPWPAVTLMGMKLLPFYVPVLASTNQYIVGTALKTCLYGDALTPKSNHHHLFLVKDPQVYKRLLWQVPQSGYL